MKFNFNSFCGFGEASVKLDKKHVRITSQNELLKPFLNEHLRPRRKLRTTFIIRSVRGSGITTVKNVF